MKIISFITSLILLAFVTSGQTLVNGKISLEVLSDNNMPLENASASLFRAIDSSLYKTTLSDKKGLVEFSYVKEGKYIIKISFSGLMDQYTSLAEISDIKPLATLPIVVLSVNSSAELKEVTVTAKKPFIQKLSDRLVVNVDNSIVSAGSSAMDVLERSPGVNIDQNDVIGLRGRQGVIIMIDGKPTPMTGSDLANYLRGLPSSAIDRIDIITNPSAKYEASGNSGIIDIHMKKDQRMGINGTASAGYGQGVYPKENAGTTFNYRNKKINLFGNYNYAYRIGLNHLLLDRNFYEDGIYNGGDLKDNYSKSPLSSNTARWGMDLFLSKKTIAGFVVNGNFNHFTRKNNNSSIMLDPQRQQQSTFRSLATNNDHGNNYVANVNYKHTFDSTGKELSADVDFGEYNSNSLTLNSTSYYKLDGSFMQPNYTLEGDQVGKLLLRTAKFDYTNPMKKGVKWEAGFKTSYVSADNDARFTDMSSGSPVNDVKKTNHFLYKEYNNAGYVNFSKDYKKFDFQIGLRGEQTNINTQQRIGNVKFDSGYFQLFPSAFFNYKLKEDQSLGISVSRRIDRPGYSQLNPFLFLIDVTTYATGQPGLLPQLTWSYELSYTVKDLNFSLNYSHTTDDQNITLARFKEAFPTIALPSDTNVTVQIPINLQSSDYVGLTIAAPVKITKWWNMINNANIYYQKYNGSFSGTTLNNGKPAADLRTDNTFTFKKGWAAELNGSFSSGGQYGFMVTEPQWGISAGVQKTVLKSKGTIRLNMTDIFWTNLPKAVITYNNYIEKWHAYRETRVANINFTYGFGNNKVQAARRRTTGSEEERRRAQ
ncbi:MAG: outer membrane beta-barrel family protein [Ferruginibacter sp.]